MRAVRAWFHRLRNLFRRQRLDHELADEMESHLELHIADNLARGMTPEEARRQALVKLGGMEQTKELYRDRRGLPLLQSFFQDLRYGARTLRHSPGFTMVALLTLALGVGATAAVFSVVNPILFESLPYPQAERLTMVWDRGADGAPLDIAFGTYRELSERNRSFDAIAVMRSWQPTITGPAEPERLDGQRVSAGYFRVLGLPPAMGRDFQASDDRLHGPRVVILSHRLWQRRFGGDRAIVGREIKLDDANYTVLGVMPAAFENVLSPSAEIWAPLQYDVSEGRAWGHHLRMVGRLRPGVGADQAAREVNAIAQAPLPEFPRPTWAALGQGLTVHSLQQEVTRGVTPALLAVLGAVLLVLGIACVNVVNLLLARGVRRQGEFALRAALGAGRGRLIRQLLTESLLLAVLGGSLGMLVAQFGVETLVALSPPGLPRVEAIHLDNTVLAFGLLLTTLLAVAFGVAPALQASRSDPQRDLQHASRRTGGGHRRTRGALVVAQVALAMVLLVSAGLLLRSLANLFAISPGFDTSHLLTMQVQTSCRQFDTPTTQRFFTQALENVRRVPGTTSAAFTSQLPLSGDLDEYGVHFEATPARPAETHPGFRYAVSPGYIETMGIALRRGRVFDQHDSAGAPRVALISESLARRRFRDADPLGQRLRVGPTDGPLYTVVGIVDNVKQLSLAAREVDAVYIPASQWSQADQVMWLVIRARGDAGTLVPAIREAIWSVDKDQPIVRIATMDDLLAASAGERRFALILFATFALAALALAAAGIYGVISGNVAERTHEIGVRAALGASRGSILALILRQGMRLAGLGAAIGLAGATAASQVITSLLFGVSHLDTVTYCGVLALVLGVAGVACGVPAWRAARVDPLIALRCE